MNPFFEHRFEIERDGRAIDILILFLAADRFPEEEFANLIEDQVGHHLPPSELLLITRETVRGKIADLLMNSRASKAALQRLAGRTHVEMIGFGTNGTEMGRSPIQLGSATSGISLADVMRRGSTAIFRARQGFVVSTPSYHFENPSGRHTDRFIRLSNILIRQAEISFIAFCLLPHLPEDAEYAYIDTPALYTVVAAVNEHWRSIVADRPPLLAENFRSYGGLGACNFETEGAVALISASSSGGLARDLEGRGFDRDRVVHVLYLGKTPDDLVIACDLKYEAKRNPDGFEDDRTVYDSAEDCAYCAEGSSKIPLRGDQFDIAGPQPRPVIVNRTDAPAKLAEQMRRFQGAGLLQVGLGHRTAGGERLHQVAVGPLLDHEAFKDRLRFMVRRYVPAGIRHCIAADAASEPMARLILEQNGSSAALHDRASLDILRGEIQADRKANRPRDDLADAILVVASVVESGRILLDVSRELRDIFPEAPIIYLVGVANSAGKARREALARTLGLTDRPAQHQLAIVEELILPPSTHINAWRQELALYNEATDDGAVQLSPSLAERHERLRRSSKPLTNELFVPLDNQSPLKLQMGFAFWQDGAPAHEHSQADVFFTISSVLQHLRSNADANKAQCLRSDWYQQTLLAPDNFGRFNDGVIQSAILRAARPAELNYASDREVSLEARNMIRRILLGSNGWRGEAAAEFLIGIGTGRLKLATEDLRAVLEPIDGAPALVSELMQLCVRRLIGKPEQKSPSIVQA